MPGIQVRPNRTDELMLAVLSMASEEGATINARKLFRVYHVRYKNYQAVVAALNHLTEEGYLIKTSLHKWEMTVEGLHYALALLAAKYKREHELA